MKWTAQKKRAERAVLRMIYDLEKFESVEPSEHPDAVLRRSGVSTPFGVEITEFFDSEASARMDHIRGYVLDLLAGGRHRHKDDIEALPVEEVTLTDQNGAVKAITKGVMQALPPVADHIRMVAERIEAKSGSYSEPLLGLSHVNLIVLDRTGRFAVEPPSLLTKVLMKIAAMRQALASTTFREVFYIAEVQEHRNVFFPLRALFLLSELYLFNAARAALANEEVTVQSRDEELTLFASFMRSRGVPVLLAGGTDESVQVTLGNTGVLVPEESVTIRQYTDWPLPPTWAPPERTFSESFCASYEKFSAENAFECGMVFDVRK